MSSDSTHFARMQSNISVAEERYRRATDRAQDRQVFVAMFRGLMDDCSRFLEEITGEKDALNGSFESVKDDIDEAFFKIIAAEEQSIEDSRDPVLRAAARADAQRQEVM